jgi:hypothetical protein
VKVSVKGVLLVDGYVALVRNERDEWELPGGRLEAGELLDVWRYAIPGAGEVLIVTYAMQIDSPEHARWLQGEHRAGTGMPAHASSRDMPFVFALALAGFVASGVLATIHGPERPL